MIISCEECGKTYSINISNMSKEKLQTKCTQCGFLMTIYRDKLLNGETPAEVKKEELPDKESKKTETGDKENVSVESKESVIGDGVSVDGEDEKREGKWYQSIGFQLIFSFLACIVIIGITLAVLYVKQISPIIAKQIDLRGYSLSKSLSSSVLEPLILRNYLNVNQIAMLNAQLPGIAYVSVINHRGIVVSGIIDDLEKFTPEFQEYYKKQGFPADISKRNSLSNGLKESAKDLDVGGQKIHDVAMMIGDSAGTVHVGIFVDEIEREVRQGLVPLIILLIVLAVAGTAGFIIIARNIVTPIRALTDTAKRIGLGEIDDPVSVRGNGEIADLSKALELMRLSIKSAIMRLRSRTARTV